MIEPGRVSTCSSPMKKEGTAAQDGGSSWGCKMPIQDILKQAQDVVRERILKVSTTTTKNPPPFGIQNVNHGSTPLFLTINNTFTGVHHHHHLPAQPVWGATPPLGLFFKTCGFCTPTRSQFSLRSDDCSVSYDTNVVMQTEREIRVLRPQKN